MTNKEKFNWNIHCKHTPEIIDRILMPIRKRAMMVTSIEYHTTSATEAKCNMQFEADALEAEKIYKNMLRVVDIIHIER